MLKKLKDKISLQGFEWLLKQRGYQYWQEDELEKVIAVRGTHPDFYVKTPQCEFLAEVKSFEAPSVIDEAVNRGIKVGVVEPKDLLKRLSGACKEAARQLKPYADLNLPMIIVLDNWRRVRIPLNPQYLIQLFGVIEFRGECNPKKGITERIRPFHGGKRQLGPNLHSYVSAVVVQIPTERYIDDDFNIERQMRVRILHNPYAKVSLHPEVFRDETDTIISYSALESRWEMRPGRWKVSMHKEMLEEDTWSRTRIVELEDV
ncbi:MAG: hypothetical protein A4E53_03852 [Pelotomaculum sp. PtaB.Bin104]|nr:MAG: hypothetical protein A4E53_03852 [Pelotomaculum sp. PtaB.Bin104]